MPTLTFILIYK